MKWGPCPSCRGTELFRSGPVDSGTINMAPNLLPGLGSFLTVATYHLVVCRTCGLTRFFASPEATDKLEASVEWKRVP